MEIDIRGPQGNAFSLMGNAQRWAKQLGFSKEHTDKIMEEMSKGDYENVLDVIEREFGNVVTLVGRDEADDDE